MAVPQLRFKEFKEEWQKSYLSKLLSEPKVRNYDMRFDKKDVLSVSGEQGIVNQIAHLGRSYAGELVDNYHVVEVGDVVYTKSPLKSNPYGIIKVNKGLAGIVSTLYAVYRPTKNCNGLWLDFYFELDDHLNKYLRPIVRKGAKNDMKVNNSDVLQDPIYFPQVTEQQKIASFLTTVDERISLMEKKHHQLTQYKKGVMQQIFSQKIRFKQDDGSDFPDWEEKRLGDICSKITSSLTAGELVDGTGSYPVYGAAGTTACVDFFKQEKPYIGIVKDGAGVGKVVMCQAQSSFVGTLDGVEPKDENNINYIYSIFQQIDFAKFTTGSTIPHIYFKDYSKLKIKVPHPNEQKKVASFLAAIDTKTGTLQSQITAAKIFKKGLLQMMFV